jgi:hypothetical protein
MKKGARIAMAAALGLALFSSLVVFAPRHSHADPKETRLLFSFVTNQVGYDTGIIISNTSSNPFSTPAQSGTCTLYFYGPTAPASPVTTLSIASGSTYAVLLSSLAPGYQGYMIADCNFGFAEGVMFLSTPSGGSSAISGGYTAKVLPLDTPLKNN